VLLNGKPVRSCLMFAVQADGAKITTVEGLAPEPGSLSILQDSFWETHALQCGFCTSGMLISTVALLRSNAHPSRDEIRRALSGNLCRCTGYQNIVNAVELAAQRMSGASTASQVTSFNERL
jgi:carbon-monoxide dehydrogenase small subunit